MSSISLHTSPTAENPSRSSAPVSDQSPAPLEEILAPLHAAAQNSASFVASRHSVNLRGSLLEIPKFLLLGQRGGGQPIRLGLFAGFEAGNLETVEALSRLLLQLKASPSSSRDFALLAYPVVNVRGFTPEAAPLADFEARFARDSVEPDVKFFKTELNQWRFNGLLSFPRTDPSARGFYAAVRSEIIAAEVVEPALAAAAVSLPLATQAVKVRPDDRYARTADYAHGRLSPPADVRPYPFEIEIFAPRGAITEERVDGLFVVMTEILRLYRAFIAHGQGL